MPATIDSSSGSQGPTERFDRAERLVVVAILSGLTLLLLVQFLAARWRRGVLELERLPEHQLDFRIDINTANEIELVHLPSVGPVLAKRIVADRESAGPFRKLEDLERVKGVGPKNAQQIAPYLRWPDAPPAQPASGP